MGDSDIEIIEVEAPPKKKLKKSQDPEDDYDLDDDFIDDTEVNDEEVPDEISTACGGFYVNTGSLKFKYKDDVAKENQAQPTSTEEREKVLAASKNLNQQS